MGIFSAILLAPLAPVRGVVALADVIKRQAEQELYNPANTRRQLEALEEARERGEISAEEEEKAQEEILAATLMKPSTPGAEPQPEDE